MSKRNTLNPMQLYTVKIGNLDKNIEDIKRVGIEGDKKEKSESFPLDASHLTKITFNNQDLAEAFDPNIIFKVITCKSEDGPMELDTIFVAPIVSPLKPLPIYIFIHGRADDRTTLSFNSKLKLSPLASNNHRSLCLHQTRPTTAKTSRSSMTIIAVVADEMGNAHPGHTAVSAQ